MLTSLQQNFRQYPIFRKLCMSMSNCEMKDDCLYYQGCIYILDSENLWLYLINQAHTSPSDGHGGKSCTFELLTCHYYCPGLAQRL